MRSAVWPAGVTHTRHEPGELRLGTPRGLDDAGDIDRLEGVRQTLVGDAEPLIERQHRRMPVMAMEEGIAA